MLDVPSGLFGGEGLALAPLGVADGEGPGLEILRGFPFAREMWPGHVVDAGAGQIAADLADDIRVVHPREGVRIVDLRDALGDADGAALRNVLRHRRLRNRLTGDLARPH